MWIRKRVWNGLDCQSNDLPCDHGMSVAPSGRFPSVLDKPAGSVETGIWARLIDLLMMSFSSACRCYQALLRLHDNPCIPLAFTSYPRGQVWGSHVQSPNIKPTAIRIISSLSFNSIDVIGGAISQSPEWGNNADRMRALSTSEESWDEISANWLLMTERSQTFCMCRTSSGGSDTPAKMVHEEEALRTSMSGMLAVRDGRKRFWSDSADAAEAKKAEASNYYYYFHIQTYTTFDCAKNVALCSSWYNKFMVS